MRDDFARPPVLLTVVDEEVLERDVARRLRRAQAQPCAKCDQGGRHVADGGAVGNIAADSSRVADLLAGKAPQQFPEGWPARSQNLGGLRNAHAGAETDRLPVLADGRQAGDAAEMNQRPELTLLLGDEQAEVRGAADDARIRVAVKDGEQLLFAPRRVEDLSPRLKAHSLRMGDAFEHLGVGLAPLAVVTRARVGGHPTRRRGDGPVTGAAAEVAGEQRIRVGLADRPAVQVARIERHDEARSAEAALGAVAVDHGLLAGMQLAAGTREVLDRQHELAFELRQESDAGVDGAICDPAALKRSDHHRAGAAIALRAAFLGACQRFRPAQILEKRRGRVDPANGLDLAIQHKGYAVTHRARCRTCSTARRIAGLIQNDHSGQLSLDDNRIGRLPQIDLRLLLVWRIGVPPDQRQHDEESDDVSNRHVPAADQPAADRLRLGIHVG